MIHPNRDVSKSIAQRQRMVRAGTMHWVHWAVVAFSLLLTVTAWYFSKRQVEEKVVGRFQREADQVVELVKERMELYENALWGGVGLFDASEEVTYPEWMTYANSLRMDKRYPGINGIGVIFNIQPPELEGYLTRERRWRPGYDIHPQHDESEYWPITFIEPAEPNKKAVGLDMAFETNRYTAVQKARDTGLAQVTGPITLIQDAKKTPGFLFYAPFYKGGRKPDTAQERREHIVGVAYAPFIMTKLMQGTLAQSNRHVGLRISDGQDILYDDHDGGNDSDIDIDQHPLYRKSIEIDMYGRNWKFDVWSDLDFRAATASNQPYMILAGGIIIDSLLLALFILLSRANRRAVSYADQLTEDLRVKTKHLEIINKDLDLQIAQRTQAEERFRATIEASPTGMITVNRHGVITLVNKQTESMFGYTRDELLGQKLEQLVPPELRDAHVGFRSAFFEAPHMRTMGQSRDLAGHRKDGSEFPIEVGLTPLETPDGLQVLATIMDITERKHHEQLLHLQMQELTQTNKDLDEFAYVASHDLRSPLEGINKLAKWIHEDNADLPDKSKRHLEQMQRRIGRLANLLDDLLQYSRARRREYHVRSVDTGQLARDVAELSGHCKGFTVSIAPDMPTLVTAKTPLEQVLRNLISNAIKHHDRPDGTVKVSCHPNGKLVEFEVSDDGPGIDPQFHDQIFKMFTTLKPRDEVEGSGMGLAIIKKLVERYGGKITVHSDINKGTTFRFTWPKMMQGDA